MRQINKQQNIQQISHHIEKIEEKENSEVFNVSIRISFSLGWIENVKFAVSVYNQKRVYQLNYLKSENDYAIFEVNVEITKTAICYYYFSFYANGIFSYYKKSNITGNNSITKEEYWKLSVGFNVPEWAKGANMYHIFVDRFYKSSKNILLPMPRRTIHENWNEPPILGPDENGIWNADFYGGDLIGIKEKISYLKSLSIDIVYLSPICTSQSNHRYDTADYENVDPYLGNNEDLKTLCYELHKNGIRIILDAVFNHTGDDSKYFNKLGTYSTVGAYQSQDSPFFDFYKKHWFQGKHYFSYWWGMHTVMNYFFIHALIRYYKYADIFKLENTLKEILIDYPDETIQTLMNFTSTHDISRLIEFFATDSFQEYGEWTWNLLNDNLDWISSHKLTQKEYNYGKITLKSYITALAFLPGIFSIFYGDEVGLCGIGNLANRAPFPWNNEDHDLLSFFQKICFIRKKETFLRTAELKILELNNYYFSYERYDGKNSIIVVASRTHHVINLEQQFSSYKTIFSLTNCSTSQLSPYGAIVLKN